MCPKFEPPWSGFLEELDDLLDEPFEFHCIGGFAVVVEYGLPRGTNDLDYFTLVPANRITELEKLAGEGSDLARKHKVHVHHAAIATLPENYEERMKEIFPGHFKKIIDRDRDDAKHLSRTLRLDGDVLKERYYSELRHALIGPVEWHDQTLAFWLEAYFDKSENTRASKDS
jgi:Nucleotidyltransferase of unknown function (DUF6036)